jgi:hypothetical protein
MGSSNGITLTTLWRKIDNASQPIPATEDLAPNRLPRDIPQRLVEKLTQEDFLRVLDIFDPVVAERRAQYRNPASHLHGSLAETIARVQNAITTKIVSRGVIIETNPSSNMRMLRLTRAAELPIIRLLADRKQDLRVTICTDNPGVYDADVETEYGITFSGLLDLLGRENRDQCLRLLEHVRNVGLRQAT